jgi:hypothetical protein
VKKETASEPAGARSHGVEKLIDDSFPGNLVYVEAQVFPPTLTAVPLRLLLLAVGVLGLCADADVHSHLQKQTNTRKQAIRKSGCFVKCPFKGSLTAKPSPVRKLTSGRAK